MQFAINLDFMKASIVWMRPGGRGIQAGAVRKVLDVVEVRSPVRRTVPGHINTMKVVMVMKSMKMGLK